MKLEDLLINEADAERSNRYEAAQEPKRGRRTWLTKTIFADVLNSGSNTIVWVGSDEMREPMMILRRHDLLSIVRHFMSAAQQSADLEALSQINGGEQQPTCASCGKAMVFNVPRMDGGCEVGAQKQERRNHEKKEKGPQGRVLNERH